MARARTGAQGMAPLARAHRAAAAAVGRRRDTTFVAPLTPEQRKLRASIAAYAMWSREADPAARTAGARKAFLDRFEREVDPNGELEPAERARQAEQARKSHFRALALRSARVRAARARGDAPDAAA